ncbi:MAG: zf-HC2 domain-containing protein [Armatimonadetes bacterium]|nr:zf-HC2 domain-containing protein [Armatimonadota bacterium]
MEKETVRYIDCLDAFYRLHDYLSCELGEAQVREIRKHLELCGHCAARYHFEETLFETIREKVHGDRVPATLRARIHALLNGDSFSAE